MLKFTAVGPRYGDRWTIGPNPHNGSLALLCVSSIVPGATPEDDPVNLEVEIDLGVDDLKTLRRACKHMIEELERVPS